MQSNPLTDVTQAQQTIESTILAVQSRKTKLSLESGLWVGLWYGLAMASAPTVLDLAFGVRPPLPEPFNQGIFWGGVVLAGALLMGAIVGIVKRTTKHDAAKLIDNQLGLKDRISSALNFSKDPDPAERLAIQDAAVHAKSVNPEKVLPRVLSRPPAFAVGTLLASAVIIAGGYGWRYIATPDEALAIADSSTQKEKDKRQKEIDKLAEEFKKLAEGAKKIGANQETQEFLERAKKDLERLKLEQRNLSKSEVLSRLSELEKSAKDIAKNIDPKESNEAMSRAAQSLEKGLENKSVSDALASQDFKKAAEELEKFAEEIAQKASQQTKEEVEKKARELEKAADELKKQDPELAEALKKAAEMMEKGDFAELKKALEEAAKKMKRTPETLARRKASAKAMAAALERLEGAKVEVSDKPTYASGNPTKKPSAKKPSSGKKIGGKKPGGKPGKVTIKPGGTDPGGESGESGESGEGGEGGDMELSMGNCDPSSEDCFMLPIPGGEGGEGGEGNGGKGEKGNGSETGTGPGGAGHGGGHDDNGHGPALDEKGVNGSEFISSDAGPAGETSISIVRGMVGEDNATEGYSDIFKAFKRIAEESMYTEEIPLTRRQYVRSYFELIRPDNTPTKSEPATPKKDTPKDTPRELIP